MRTEDAAFAWARNDVRGYNTHPWRGSKAVMQWPAKPSRAVRLRPAPPNTLKKRQGAFFISCVN